MKQKKQSISKKYVPVIQVGALFIVILFIILVANTGKGSHQFEGKCSLCHVGLKNPKILTKEIDHLCLSCHPDNAKRSHPSGFIPPKPLPARYPTVKGKLVCISCHFPHEKLGPAQLPSSEAADSMQPHQAPGPYMLRAARAGKVFCFSCHKSGFSREGVDSHAITSNRAHTPSTALSFQQKQMMDDKSRECLSCHDGTITSNTHTQIRSLSWQHKKNIGMSHPISMDYRQVYLSKPREYHPPEQLDKRITLINGKVGCETCHNHYSKHKKHLVMDNFRSRLCLNCHNL